MSGGLVAIYRHPVKGLRPETLDAGELATGLGLVGDRAFAFQFTDGAVPAELRNAPAGAAPWMPKFHLAVQHDWPDLARIKPEWDASARVLRLCVESGDAVEGVVDSSEGRTRLARFIQTYLSDCRPFEKARHPSVTPLRLIGGDSGGPYPDGSRGPLSIALRESFDDLETRFGFSVDERRFRLNLILEGAPAWSELTWAGRRLRIGPTVIEVVKPIGRCPNIDVDPDTGERRDEIFPTMKAVLGHSFMGMRAEIVQAGPVRSGDDWELLPSPGCVSALT